MMQFLQTDAYTVLEGKVIYIYILFQILHCVNVCYIYKLK
jgi:hypothetical protein